ncbi:sensor domain-containing diguanylate cyclase [Neobacillus sp. K501]
MGVKPQVKRAIFLIWLLIVPAGMWYTYHTYPPQIYGNWVEVLGFLVLTAVVASMPMKINNTNIFLIQWVSLATFLSFGLFIEMVLAQAAVLVLLLKTKTQKDELFRIPLNLSMFFLISFLSGIIYYALGGQTGSNLMEDPSSIWLAMLYVFLSYSINQVIISIILHFVYNESYFGKDFIVETVTTMITFPIGIILYVLYQQMGLLAVLFVGIPFVSISIIFSLYYSSQKVNEYLQKAAEIGHQMAERLKVKDVIDLFIQKLAGMLPVDYAYILEVINDEEMQLIRRLEGGNEVTTSNRILVKKNEGLAGKVWAKQKAFKYSSKKTWEPYLYDNMPNDVESILAVPIVRSQKVIGVLILASRRKRAYEKFEIAIVDILCSYYAVAIENAKHYELTKMHSERCALTNLYNYRYFEKLVTEEFEKLFQFERKLLSLIILDIDHFKKVNDTYGHQSGNEILIQLADRLTKLVGKRGTVARYGGEEFVVLLPEVDKEDAFDMAERIRETIADIPFTLKETLDQNQLKVQITASIGVATAPEDAEDYLALIRHADRALYVGAKRAGRNRVAEYSSC